MAKKLKEKKSLEKAEESSDKVETMQVETATVVLEDSEDSEDSPSAPAAEGPQLPKLIEAVLVPVGLIQMNDWNPFEQTDETFNLLCEEIESEGFDEPVKVSPLESGTSKIERDETSGWLIERGDKKYRIVDGEHRFKAARVLEMPLIPAAIKDTWDERTQKIQTVRRNMIKGAVNPRKFTNLVEDIANRFGIGQEAIARKMGVFDQKQFGKWYLQKKKEKKQADSAKKDTQKAVQAVENLTATLNEICRKHGGTIPQGYVVFAYKGQVNLMVSLDGKLKRTVEALVEFLRVSGANANAFVHEALEQKMLTTSLAVSASEKAPIEDADVEAEAEAEADLDDTDSKE